MARIGLKNINMSFGTNGMSTTALENINLSVEDVKKYADFDKTVIADSIFSEHFNYSPDPNKKAIEQWRRW